MSTGTRTRLLRGLRRLLGSVAVVAVALAVLCGGWASILRMTGNVHEIEPGVLRSGQLGAARLSKVIQAYRIRTVLNLRGEHPGTAWYDAETKVAREAGVRYVSIGLSANREPDRATLASLVAALREATTPLLIHCEAGADRSGLASALYEVAVKHRSPDVAWEQLSFRYGHFPWLLSRTGAMDRAFRRALTELD